MFDISKKVIFLILLLIIKILTSNNKILDKIIGINEPKFRYFNFVKTSKGDLFIESCSYPCTGKRIFIGFKSNGRYYYENENRLFMKEIMVFNSSNIEQSRLESVNFLIDLGVNKTEYLLSITKSEMPTELFDFETNDIIFHKRTN